MVALASEISSSEEFSRHVPVDVALTDVNTYGGTGTCELVVHFRP